MDAREWQARLQTALARAEPPWNAAPEEASAVLLPLRFVDGVARIVLTHRGATLPVHPGEVSLPGGRVHAGETPLDAALRETEEEIGVPAKDVEVLGYVTDARSPYGRTVRAYAGILRTVPRIASEAEVQEILEIPLDAFLDPAIYEARTMPGFRGGRVVHYWRFERHTVWGMTGHILATFLERACAWTPPKSPVRIEEPSGFRP